MNDIKEYTTKLFEDIKHIDEFGNEYWLARELQNILEYTQWRRFENVINKAKFACKNSNIKVDDHFANVGKMVDIGSNTKRITKDYRLTRYACYLIAQNGDSRKEVIALAQTYFAIQTRKQELSEKEYNEFTEDEKRLYMRNQVRKGNYNLNKTAVKAHVKDLARFHNAGYKGLYNGETADDIFKRKKLRYREDILDNMGSEELANNIFRIAQTDAKLKRDKVDNEHTANSVHYEVGMEVRESIKRLGGTMPENLPTPNRSLKELEKERHKVITYFEIGKLLNEAGGKYGDNIIDEYSKKLVVEVGKKYNRRTLFRMKQFYNIFSNEKVSTLWTQLTWSHLRLLFNLEIDSMNYYIKDTMNKNLSVRELEFKIKSNEYQRLPIETKNKLILDDEIDVKDLVPNPILIRNKNNIEIINEKALHKIITEDIESFMKELGNNFSFIGSEYKIKIGDRYNYIDLLLFNIKYNAYVVVELKVTEFKVEYISQVQKYMNYVDKNIKELNNRNTIGILICKKENKFVIEYCSDERITIREYELV